MTPEQLNDEVEQLVEILLSKAPEALRRTKYYLDQGSDLPYSQTLAFEGVPREAPAFQGVKDFADTELRNERRKLLGGSGSTNPVSLNSLLVTLNVSGSTNRQ